MNRPRDAPIYVPWNSRCGKKQFDVKGISIFYRRSHRMPQGKDFTDAVCLIAINIYNTIKLQNYIIVFVKDEKYR